MHPTLPRQVHADLVHVRPASGRQRAAGACADTMGRPITRQAIGMLGAHLTARWHVPCKHILLVTRSTFALLTPSVPCLHRTIESVSTPHDCMERPG